MATSHSKAPTRWFSTESLTRKASLNALTAGLEYGARVVTGFVLQPLLVAGLGNYLYGAWQVLTRLTGYLSAASGRSPQALKWTIASHQTSADAEQKRRFVGSTVVVWLLFLPLLAGLGAVVAWFSPSWLNAPGEVFWAVRLTAAVLVANLILVSLVDIPRSVLCGENLGYKLVGVSAAVVVTGGGLTALAVTLDLGLLGVATAALATTLLTGIVLVRVVRSNVPWFAVARPSRVEVRRFLGLSGWFLSWLLVNRAMLVSDVVVLGLCDSAEMVTTFTLTKHTPETMIHLIAIIVTAICPGLGRIIGSGDLAKAARIRGEMLVLTWIVTTAVGTTVLLWNQAFIRLWVGEQYYAGAVPTLLIIVMIFQFVLFRNESGIIDLTLNIRRKVLLGGFSAIVSLGLAVFLVGPMQLGVTGVCLGFIAGRTILTVSYPWLASHLLGISLRSQLSGIPRPALVTILLFGPAAWLGSSLTVDSWLLLVGGVGTTVMLVAAAAYGAGLSDSRRQSLLRRFRTVMRLDATE